jgi:hypothetical protein
VSGRVLGRPARLHHCRPGWTTRDAFGGPPFFLPPGTKVAVPPAAHEYPAGTVWQCRECGRTWVSTGPMAPNAPGFIGFRPERRLERRRRLKAGQPQPDYALIAELEAELGLGPVVRQPRRRERKTATP